MSTYLGEGHRPDLTAKRICSIDVPGRKKELPDEVNQLAQFVESVIFPEHGKGNRLIGNWFPIYGKRPREILPFLYFMFKDLFESCKNSSQYEVPRFVDCGSGYGIVGAVASIAGFEVYNVEIQDNIHESAVRYGEILSWQNVVDGSKIHHIHGSYYTPLWHAVAVDQYRLANGLFVENIMTRRMDIIAMDLDLKQDALPEDAIKALMEQGKKTNALLDAHLINADGFLGTDVVYIYPSDPLFNYGFPSQCDDLMYAGTYLLTASRNSQVETMLTHNQLPSFALQTKYVKANVGQNSALEFLAFKNKGWV